VIVLVALLLLPFAAASSALACVVGTGTSASCTEAALNACLPSSPTFDGTVTFDCGPGDTTITVTGTKSISAATTIDGGTDAGGPKTFLSGGGTLGIMFAMTAPFTIQNLKIQSTTGNPAIFRIGSSPAPLTVTSCVLSDNQIAIDTTGPVRANDSTFDHNFLAINAPDVMVSRSHFSNNEHGINGTTFAGTVTVTDTTFAGNQTSTHGAGISTSGHLIVSNCTFQGNMAAGNGGAILGGGPTSVTNSTFVDNHAGSNNFGGGAIKFSLAQVPAALTVTNCTFSGNGAGAGGAISTTGPVTLVNTILTSSSSGGSCSGDDHRWRSQHR